MSDVGFVSAEGKKCLVLGVNGQDGSYLAQHLLSRNCSVIGVGRQANSRWIGKGDGFSYSPLDLGDVSKISSFLDDCKPDLIFHFAAVHGAAGFSYEEKWVDVHNVNTLTTHAVLEYLRRRMPQGALIFASSSKAFGSTLPPIISESSERKSTFTRQQRMPRQTSSITIGRAIQLSEALCGPSITSRPGVQRRTLSLRSCIFLRVPYWIAASGQVLVRCASGAIGGMQRSTCR
jgi:NAD(P)-dependent dehydrogenase (short-subunit alcohol dehydrogenase family)